MLLVTAIVIGSVLAWLACGAPAYAMTFAYFQREFPSLAEDEYGSDLRLGLMVGTTGPVGLITTLAFLLSKRTYHGLKWH